MKLGKANMRRKITVLIVGIVILSSIITMGFSSLLSKNVNLIIEGEEKNLITYSYTVADFLKSENIEVSDATEVTPSLDTEIVDNMDIIVETKREFKIQDGLEVKKVNVAGTTVEQVLANADIKLGKYDVVNPKLSSEALPSKSIVIERVTKEEVKKDIELDFAIIEKENSDMKEGQVKVLQEGKKGKKIDTIQSTFVNGSLVSTDVIKSEVVESPIHKIVEVGSKEIYSSRLSGVKVTVDKNKNKTINGKKVKAVYILEATAYDPTAGAVTALGTDVRVGAVAVDPTVIPLRSKLYVESLDDWPSYGYAVAEDTGGAIKGNRIDLFYNTNEKANDFGRRNVRVYVLED